MKYSLKQRTIASLFLGYHQTESSLTRVTVDQIYLMFKENPVKMPNTKIIHLVIYVQIFFPNILCTRS